MHSKGKVSMYKPGGRPTDDGKIAVVQTEKSEKTTIDDDDFVQTKKLWSNRATIRFNMPSIFDWNYSTYLSYYKIKNFD